MLVTREFLLLALASGAGFHRAACLCGLAPAIVLDHWHLDETMFAALNLPIIGGYTIGAVAVGPARGAAGAAAPGALRFPAAADRSRR